MTITGAFPRPDTAYAPDSRFQGENRHKITRRYPRPVCFSAQNPVQRNSRPRAVEAASGIVQDPVTSLKMRGKLPYTCPAQSVRNLFKTRNLHLRKALFLRASPVRHAQMRVHSGHTESAPPELYNLLFPLPLHPETVHSGIHGCMYTNRPSGRLQLPGISRVDNRLRQMICLQQLKIPRMRIAEHQYLPVNSRLAQLTSLSGRGHTEVRNSQFL